MGVLDQADMQGVNFADAEAPSFDALPRGWYPTTITDVEEGETSDGAKKYPKVPYGRVEFTCTDDSEYENRRFWRTYLVHPDFLGALKQLLVASGVYSEAEVNADGFDFDWDELVDAQVDVKVNRKKGKGDYADTMQNNVTQVATYGDGGSYVEKGEARSTGFLQ